MGKRTLVKRVRSFYVERRKDGSIMKWTPVGRSLKADRLKKLKKKVKSGYGHRGDR